MRLETLEILRCPYCGGRLALIGSLFHRLIGDEILDGILGCHCCIFPVVDGIPVLHIRPNATAARHHVEAGQPELARRTMMGLENARESEAFDAIASSSTATYRDTVEALGPNFEGRYFLYRFSDPTYIVAQSVVQSIATTVLHAEHRAIDICGGSGHLTRSLLKLSSSSTILTDLYYAKVWLAQKFVAPGCEPVCCDANVPLPFARGTFGFAMCTDAFMYIWAKRQFVGEMERLITTGGEPGAVLIGHTHNEKTWSPSHGQPLSAKGYRDLFESFEPRVFGEDGLFADVVNGGPIDLSRHDSEAVLDRDPALSIIASRHPGIFAAHPLEALPLPVATGEFRLNPLYAATPNGDVVHLRLQFPGGDYAEEYGACRAYLPDEVVVDRAELASLPASTVTGELANLARRRVVLDLPEGYY